MSNFLTILLSIGIFGALILLHELGHYIFARIFDVEITEFAIGMGPKLFSRKSKKTGIQYSLRLLPIGGYVAMVGENEICSENPRAFSSKKVWKRIIITVAGATVNILIGFMLMCVYTFTMPAYGGTVIAEFMDTTAYVETVTPEEAVTPEGTVTPESTADSTKKPVSSQDSGLMVGDEIYSIGGTRVLVADEVVYQISMKGYEPVDVVVIRDGKKVTVNDVVFPTAEEQGIKIGMYDFKVYRIEKNFVNTVKMAFCQCKMTVVTVIDSLKGLFTGRFGIKNMSGVVGTTEAIGEAASYGFRTLLYFCAMISVNLGVFNLLPIPALDGGRLLFQLIELVRGKPIDQKYEGMIHAIGFILLMLLVVVVMFNDITKLFTP